MLTSSSDSWKFVKSNNKTSRIWYAVSAVSHSCVLTDRTSESVYRILKYLKKSPGQELLYSGHGHLAVEAYIDADWADQKIDKRSITGYCTMVGGNLVSWTSKK